MVCPNCGKKSTSKFCPDCGTKFEEKRVAQSENNKKTIKNKDNNHIDKVIIKAFFITVGIILLLLLIVVTFQSKDEELSTNNYETEKVEKKTTAEDPKKTVSRKINLAIKSISELTFEKIIFNEETQLYDVNLSYKTSYETKYYCVKESQEVIKKIKEIDEVGNVIVECFNNDDKYLEFVFDVRNLDTSNIEASTRYFDSNQNEIQTSFEQITIEEEQKFKSSCKTLNYKDVLRNPDAYNGENVHWFGEVVQVISNSVIKQYRVNVNCSQNRFSSSGYVCNDTIYVTYYGDGVFLEDDMVDIWGYMSGTITYETVLGSNVTVPDVYAKYMKLK